ncbi:MAG: hypothetical protein O6922_08215 [Chloroflexi bacterium]|nr:hypothetical protein [Chloroflexota bacterium]
MTPQELAQKLHGVPGRGCVVVTGAGIRAISDLFAQPGTSRTILEAQVPYARKALDEFVGVRANQHVSAEEALLIAEAALRRAHHLADDNDEEQLLFGVGCTAAVATDRVRRGEDRAHVAWTDGTRSGGASIWFDKNARTREEEDAIVSAVVLNAIAEAIGVDERLAVEMLDTERLDELN